MKLVPLAGAQRYKMADSDVFVEAFEASTDDDRRALRASDWAIRFDEKGKKQAQVLLLTYRSSVQLFVNDAPVNAGDFIVRTPDGFLDTVAPRIFERMFERSDELSPDEAAASEHFFAESN